MYVRHSLLADLYREYGADQRYMYEGCTIITDSFGSYTSAVDLFLQQGYGVQPFFPYASELAQIIRYARQSEATILTEGYVLVFMICMIVQVMQFLRRRFKLMRLKLNGSQTLQTVSVTGINMFIVPGISFALCAAVMCGVQALLHVPAGSTLMKTALMVTIIFLLQIVLQVAEIRRFSIVNTLRDAEIQKATR